jgi:PAS domain S-box-containing protein
VSRESSVQARGAATVDDTLLRVAEEAADGLYIVDGEGRFAFVNRAALDLFGYDDESELLGRNTHRTTHYKRRDGSPFPADECPLLRPRMTGESVHVDDDWFVRRDGTMAPVAYSSAPFPTKSGMGTVVAIRDMTQLRRAEAELRLLQEATLLLTSSEELDGGVAAVIHAVCEHTGWSAGEMWVPDATGTSLELNPGWWATSSTQQPFFRDVSSRVTLAPGESLPGAVWHAKRPVWVDVAAGDLRGPRDAAARGAGFAVGVAVPVFAGEEVVAVLGFYADRRRPDDERWTESLSAIAAQLGPVLLRKRAEDQLAQQATKLARSNAQLHSFAELLAHELQQPLDSIVRTLGHATGVPAGEQEQLLATVRGSAQRLQESIGGLMRYASVGHPRAGHVEVTVILDEALEDLSFELERVHAEVIRHRLPAVEADAVQLRTVLHNLLANAVRYRSRERLRIELGAERERSQAVLFVRDNGRGIKPAERERIFELFGRGTSATDIEGIGLGLALCRRIVEAHGGSIWVESEPDCGSTFFFTLPLTA